MVYVFGFKRPSDWQFPSISISNSIIEEGLLKAMDKHVSKLSKRFGLRDVTIIGGDSDSFFLSCKSIIHHSKNTMNLMSNPTLASFAFCKKNVSGNSSNNTYNDIYVSHDSFHANGNPYILLELCIVNRKRPPDDRLCFWIYNYKDPPVIFIIIFSFFFSFLLFSPLNFLFYLLFSPLNFFFIVCIFLFFLKKIK